MSSSKTNQGPLWRIQTGERRTILLVGDLIVAGLALFIALYFWAQKDAWIKFSWQFLTVRPPFWFYLLPFFWLLLNVELYDVRTASHRGDTIRGITIAAAISGVIYLLIYFTSEPSSLPRLGVASFIIATTVLTLLWRMLYINIFTAPVFMRRVLIVGAGKAGTNLVHVLQKIQPPPFFLVGLIDDDPEKQSLSIFGYSIIGNGEALLQVIENEKITDLICAITGDMNSTMFQVLLDAQERGVEVRTMPSVYEDLLGRLPIFLLKSDWILRSFVDEAQTGGFYEIGKRLMDIIGALVGSVLLVVLYPFIAFFTLVDSGLPIFFKQVRLGRNGREYQIIKFRTMRQDAEKDGVARMASEKDERVTRFGSILRKSHLDELPQFINVLRGEMSLVGPRAERPELINELQTQIPFYRARLFVKPGLTGWAQVNYGYASNVEQTGVKLEYDLYYIKHRNLLLDIMILIRTISTVFGLRGR
jgi:exopolysaccharide biosynthesis polyprenyl glycosylphosphotransferase